MSPLVFEPLSSHLLPSGGQQFENLVTKMKLELRTISHVKINRIRL